MYKLLQINSHSTYGAVGKLTEQLGRVASEQGWDTYLAAGKRHSRPSAQKTLSFDCVLSEYLHYLISLLFDAQGRGLASYVETKLLIRKIKKLDPDIIHIHQIHGSYINYQILLKYLAKTRAKIVFTLHDCWYYTGHCTHYDYHGCMKWKDGCHDCTQLHEYPRSLFRDSSKKNYSLKKELFTSISNATFITVSKWLEGEARRSFLKNLDIRTIYNGVDLNVFRFNPNTNLKLHDDSKYVLLGISNGWDKMKGLDDYFKLREMLPNEYKIILIGVIYGQEKNFPKGVIGVPRTANVQTLVEYYSECDIVMNLSYQESMGMTTVEGMACGKPSIVYDRTASPELVDEETGFVVKAGDIQEVVDAVISICEGKSSCNPISCRKRAELFYNKDIQYQKYIELYKELINNKNERTCV